MLKKDEERKKYAFEGSRTGQNKHERSKDKNRTEQKGKRTKIGSEKRGSVKAVFSFQCGCDTGAEKKIGGPPRNGIWRATGGRGTCDVMGAGFCSGRQWATVGDRGRPWPNRGEAVRFQWIVTPRGPCTSSPFAGFLLAAGRFGNANGARSWQLVPAKWARGH